MGIQESFDKMLALVSGSSDPMLLKSVMEVQRELVSLQEENRQLRQKNNELQNIDILRSELEYKGNAYYHSDDGPYCTTCFDRDGKLIRLILEKKYGEEFKIGRCSNCKASGIQTEEKNLTYVQEIKNRQEQRKRWNEHTQKFMNFEDDF